MVIVKNCSHICFVLFLCTHPLQVRALLWQRQRDKDSKHFFIAEGVSVLFALLEFPPIAFKCYYYFLHDCYF